MGDMRRAELVIGCGDSDLRARIASLDRFDPPPPSDQLEAILACRSESPHPITSSALLISPIPEDLPLPDDYLPSSPPLLLS